MLRRGVFKIINNVTGKVYIGSSDTNMDNLIYGYWQKLKSGFHHNKELQSDFDYYGDHNFDFEIVKDDCQSEREVRLFRDYQIYLNRHNTYNEDVPVHYGGGNPNASYASYSDKKNSVINDLSNILIKSNLSSYKTKIIRNKINKGVIETYEQLENEIKAAISDDLSNILIKSNLSSYNTKIIRNKINKGVIKTYEQLDEEIKKVKDNNMGNDYHKIKKLSDMYCFINNFDFWIKDKEMIRFISGDKSKYVHINDLDNEIKRKNKKVVTSSVMPKFKSNKTTENNNSHFESNKKNKNQLPSKKHRFKIQMNSLYVDGMNTHLSINHCQNIINVMNSAKDKSIAIYELIDDYYFSSSNYVKIVAENYNDPNLIKILR